MPLVLRVRQTSPIPLEVDPIRLEDVRELPLDELKRKAVFHGNGEVELGEFFDISGSAVEDNEIVWEGDCSKVKLIGAHTSQGSVRVVGDAGMHLGAEMSGGSIVVEGNAADWVGAEMSGGFIHVRGNAGHLVGAAYRGARRGMRGGEILVDGDAGNEIGHTMRRGFIAIGGRSGDASGFNLIAGTILLFGETGIRLGAGMRRGTIGLLGQHTPPRMLPTFRLAGPVTPLFLRLYLKRLESAGFPVPEDLRSVSYLRYCGDFLELGKGEILVRQSA